MMRCLKFLKLDMMFTLLATVCLFWMIQCGTNLEYLTDLIVVAGHSEYIDGHFEDCRNISHWGLPKRLNTTHQQRKYVSGLLSHIDKGIDLTISNENALLIFSGRRRMQLRISEGALYFNIANHCNYFKNKLKSIQIRTFTEDYALDSFQNLLFSICRFHEITNNYPTNIKVISWSFKKYRFINMHRKALKYDVNNFHFFGINGDYDVMLEDYTRENIAIDRFINDLYGCGPEVKQTRIKKNLFNSTIPYPHQCLEIKQLFSICQDGFNDALVDVPWIEIKSNISSQH